MKPTLLGRCAVLCGSLWFLATVAGCANRAADAAAASSMAAHTNNTNPVFVASDGSGTMGSIERLDPALDGLLPKDAKVEVLVKGLDWAEGPVWNKALGALLFSDVPQNVVYQWSQKGGVRPYLAPSGYTGNTPRGGEPGSNGLTIDAQGRLVLCEHGDRRVARLEKNRKSKTTLADRYEDKRLNSPNDLIFDSKGNLIFTDPAYGLEKRLEDPKKAMDFQGVFRVTPEGKMTLLTKALKFPNGLALSPDEKLLYVSESNPEKPVIWVFDVKDDGSIANQRVFFDATDRAAKKLKGLPDGMKVDAAGNLWATGPGGILILSPAGKHLGSILTGEATGICAWGDDGSSLYICADMHVCRVKTSTKGHIPGEPR
jgi:gluconolactonase